MENFLNFFRITNQDTFKIQYRLFEIGPLPEGVSYHHNLQKIKSYIGKEFGTPTAWVIRDNKRYLAVSPVPYRKPFPTSLEVPILQNMLVILRLTPEVYVATSDTPQKDIQAVVIAFVGFAVRSALRKEKDLWKGNSPYLFYSKKPIELPHHYKNRPVNLYPGFSCNVTRLSNGDLGLVIDIQHIYTDSQTLSERMKRGLDWRTLKDRHFVYELGQHWYFIQFKNLHRQSINKAQFIHPETQQTTNVYEYTLEKYIKKATGELRKLEPNDQTIVYTYPGQSGAGERYAASSLARLRYKTSDEEIGDLHTSTILKAQQRLEQIQNIIRLHIRDKIFVDGVKLDISTEPRFVESHMFNIPRQCFGHGRILNPPRTYETNDLKRYWNTRKNWLRDRNIGIFDRTGGITSQFLLMPASFTDDEDLAERVEEDLKKSVNLYSPTAYNPKLVVWDDSKAETFMELKTVLNSHKQAMLKAGTAAVLVVLPETWRTRAAKFRRHIKRILHPEIRTKCILASELLKRIPPANCTDSKVIGKYESYLSNTALDLLVTSGYWLWSLAEPTHYDFYIGIDVLNNTAGFTFIANGGAICRFFPSTSEQDEALSAEQVSGVLLQHLRELIPRFKDAMKRLPKHIIVHRDGHWHDSESMGLHHAIKQLYQEKLLPDNVLVGVVEIQKTNAQHWRLMTKDNDNVTNPTIGTYHILESEMGLICTTGRPALVNATIKPLVVRIAEGTLDIEKILRDVYWLSTLSWTKPDGVQSLPLTIKLADSWLEPIAARINEDETAHEGLIDWKPPKNSTKEFNQRTSS